MEIFLWAGIPQIPAQYLAEDGRSASEICQIELIRDDYMATITTAVHGGDPVVAGPWKGF